MKARDAITLAAVLGTAVKPKREKRFGRGFLVSDFLNVKRRRSNNKCNMFACFFLFTVIPYEYIAVYFTDGPRWSAWRMTVKVVFIKEDLLPLRTKSLGLIAK